jgi:hypothetical protein
MNVGYLFRLVFRLDLFSPLDNIFLFFLDLSLLIFDLAVLEDLVDNIFKARNW